MKKRKFVASVMVFSMLLGQTAYAQEMVMPVESAEALESEVRPFCFHLCSIET